LACINSDGTLVASARAILNASRKPSTPEQLATATGLSLYRVRGGLRELTYAGLVSEANGIYQLTEAGGARLSAPPHPA
jgi:predicted Rossmann fold nucleotide-binding protein DprA/Smf involved in DNA uptake